MTILNLVIYCAPKMAFTVHFRHTQKGRFCINLCGSDSVKWYMMCRNYWYITGMYLLFQLLHKWHVKEVNSCLPDKCSAILETGKCAFTSLLFPTLILFHAITYNVNTKIMLLNIRCDSAYPSWCFSPILSSWFNLFVHDFIQTGWLNNGLYRKTFVL